MNTNLSIYVLDDEEIVCTAIQEHLSRREHHIEVFSDCASFLKACDHECPDLAIIDIRLHDGNGLDILAHLQEQHPDLASIIVSGHGTLDHAIEAIRFGAMDYIRKPLSFRELMLPYDD